MQQFDSKEAFEEYLAQQRLSNVGGGARRKGFWEDPARVMKFFVTLALVSVPLYFLLFNRKHDQAQADRFWDGLLGAVAGVTDREYDADAATLTERLTLREKGGADGRE